MGKRKVVVKKSAARQIANVAWFIESKGMMATAEKFSDSVYDFIETLTDDRMSFRTCSEPARAAIGLKCISFKKKFMVVFLENESEITICEFLPSKLIHW